MTLLKLQTSKGGAGTEPRARADRQRAEQRNQNQASWACCLLGSLYTSILIDPAVIYHVALLGSLEIILTSPARMTQGKREEEQPQIPFMFANSVTNQ